MTCWTPTRIERLRETVIYDPTTGHFWPKKPRFGVRRDRPLGHVESNGYRRIMIGGHRFLAHRLAWLITYGAMPDETIDHINLERDDNRIANLRSANLSQNRANTKSPKSNTSGLKGAHWNRFRNYWQSYIKVSGRSIFLGRFNSKEEAHEAYVAAAHQYHGEFARGA